MTTARYRNTVSGVTVSVDAETAMRLPDSWEPLEDQDTGAAKKTSTRKRTTSRQKAEPEQAETDDDK